MPNLAYDFTREWDDTWTTSLSVQPQYPFTVQYKHLSANQIGAFGYRKQFPYQSTVRRTWQGLRWDSLTTAQATTLRDFFIARSGTKQGFTWTQPGTGGEAIKVHAVNTQIEQSQNGPGLWRVTADLQELIRHGNYGT